MRLAAIVNVHDLDLLFRFGWQLLITEKVVPQSIDQSQRHVANLVDPAVREIRLEYRDDLVVSLIPVDHPQPADRVVVHYTGWTTDGKMFDSSVTRGEPATFGVTDVIAGWTEALQRMVEGEKVRVWIPENLAYGGVPGKPAGMLVFDVELIRIN